MRATDREETNSVGSGYCVTRADSFRCYAVALPIAIAAIVGFLVLYRQLVRQARSQGFVLEQLAPLMDLLIGWGKALYWLGGRPPFVSMVLMVAAALPVMLYSLLKQERMKIAANRRIALFALAFVLMYVIGGMRNFPLFVAGVVAVHFLGWLSERGNSGEASDWTPVSRKETIFLILVLFLGLLIRLYQVDVFPRLYLVDEQLFAQVALDLGRHPLQYFSEPHIMKPHLLRVAGIRMAFSTLGVGLFQQRTVSALEGTLTILLVYLLCRKVWGNRAGLFAGFLLAVDPWHIGHSKIGVHNVEGPLFLTLLLLLAIGAYRRGGIRNFLPLGAALGAVIYLYLSCLIMAPYVFVMALIGRYLGNESSRTALLREAAVMAAAAGIVALPYFTLGRANIGELDAFYSAGGNFITSARDHGWNVLFTLFFNFWSGIDYIADWSSRAVHPAGTIYPNPLASGLFLLGAGILLAMPKKFENLLVLLWLPVAWLPMMLSYGFAERRLFTTVVPLPAMLGGLALAKLWNGSACSSLSRGTRRIMIIALLACISFISAYIIYADADPVSGGRPHPRKAAEFIGSLPPDYKTLISGGLKHNPFLVYLASYDRLQKTEDKEAFRFLSMEALAPMAEKIASTPHLALVTDVGPQERQLLKEIKALNPQAQLYEFEDFLACVIRNKHTQS